MPDSGNTMMKKKVSKVPSSGGLLSSCREEVEMNASKKQLKKRMHKIITNCMEGYEKINREERWSNQE